MSLPLEVHGFRTVLGRRMALLFLLSAVLPMSWVALEAYHRIGEQLEQQTEARVRRLVMSTGAAVLERLRMAETELEMVASLDARGVTDGPPLRTLDAVHRVDHTGSTALVGSGPGPAPPAGANPAAAASPWRLAVERGRGPAPTIWLGRADPVGRDWLWGRVRADSIMATARIHAEIPGALGVCLLQQDQVLECDASIPRTAIAAGREAGGATRGIGQLRLEGEGGPLRVGYWDMFLRGRYAAEPWVVVSVVDEEILQGDAGDFRWMFPRILIVALALVLLISHDQIRRNLQPLEALSAASRRVGAGDLGARVHTESRDEFGAVARAFNRMGRQLRGQFRSMEALHRLAGSVLAEPTRAALTSAVIREAPAVVDADAVALWLPTGAGEGLARAAVAGDVAGSHAQLRAAADVCQGQPGEVRRGGEPPAWVRGLPPFDGESFGSYLVLRIGVAGCDAVLVLAAYEAEAFPPEVQPAAQQLAEQVALALSAADLVANLERANAGALAVVSRSIDVGSPWTAGHAERVAALSVAMGRELGLDEGGLEVLQKAALLHDVGMLGIPSGLRERSGRLTPQEEDRLRDHVHFGIRVLEPLPAFAEVVPVVAQHHERWDGGGYPAGLRGEAIHPLARIIAVADTFDDLTAPRPDHDPLSARDACRQLDALAGTALEARSVRALRSVLRIRITNQDPAPAALA